MASRGITALLDDDGRRDGDPLASAYSGAQPVPPSPTHTSATPPSFPFGAFHVHVGGRSVEWASAEVPEEQRERYGKAWEDSEIRALVEGYRTFGPNWAKLQDMLPERRGIMSKWKRLVAQRHPEAVEAQDAWQRMKSAHKSRNNPVSDEPDARDESISAGGRSDYGRGLPLRKRARLADDHYSHHTFDTTIPDAIHTGHGGAGGINRELVEAAMQAVSHNNAIPLQTGAESYTTREVNVTFQVSVPVYSPELLPDEGIEWIHSYATRYAEQMAHAYSQALMTAYAKAWKTYMDHHYKPHMAAGEWDNVVHNAPQPPRVGDPQNPHIVAEELDVHADHNHHLRSHPSLDALP